LKFNRSYAEHPFAGYSKRARIQLRLLAPNVNGHVGSEENAELQDLERSLVAAGGDDMCYVGFSTHPGVRQYLFYVKSAEPLSAWRRDHRDEVERRRMVAEVHEEPSWATYQRRLKPCPICRFS
jgi:hypothetical protein